MNGGLQNLEPSLLVIDVGFIAFAPSYSVF